MDPEQIPRECVACREGEPKFVHTVSKGGVFRRLCTDCLLKEHRELFCPVCFSVFDAVPPPPHARILCINCPSITHLSCSLLPSSSTAASSSSSAPPAPFFTCPPCADPNFVFFPKSRANDDVPGTLVDLDKAKALVAAANISVTSMKNVAAQLKEEADKKILEAQVAKSKAKGALVNLLDIVGLQKDAETRAANKRKLDDR